MVALLTTAGLSEICDPKQDQERYQKLAATLAFLVGCMQAGMGFLKLEFVARFLPHPVLSGFTSAAAIVIGMSQLKDVFKLNLPRSEKLHVILQNFFENVQDSHTLTMVMAFSSIAALLLARHAKRRFKPLKQLPEALFLVVFWILVSHFAEFKNKGVKVLGEVPSGFPAPRNILWGDIGALVSPALSISLVGFLESFAVAKTIAEKEGYRMSAQRELIGLGMCNIAGAFFRCMPVTGGFSRSAVNYQAGAKSTLASMVTAFSLLLTVLFLTPLFRDLPKPILSAIIIVAVSTLVDFGEFKHLWRTDKRDFLLVLTAFTCTLFWGLLEGILVSAGFALVLLVQKVASPHSAVLVRIQQHPYPVYRNRQRFPEGENVDGVLIFRMDAPLFFANCDAFKDSVIALAAERDMAAASESSSHGRDVNASDDTKSATLSTTRVVVIHGGAMPHIDSSGVLCLEQIRKRLLADGRTLVMCEFNGPCRDILAQAGFSYDASSALPSSAPSSASAETPMFMPLDDAVLYASQLVEAARKVDVAVDVSALLVGVDDDSAAAAGAGAGGAGVADAGRLAAGSSASLYDGGRTVVAADDL